MKKSRILLVEDDPDIAEAMTDVLKDEGHEVVSAFNGKEALALLATDPLPQLIFLDLMMPQMDGAQFRAVQVQDPRLSKIPVVLISADRNLATRAKELGIDAWLSKPTTPDKVLAAAERFASQ